MGQSVRRGGHEGLKDELRIELDGLGLAAARPVLGGGHRRAGCLDRCGHTQELLELRLGRLRLFGFV